MSSRSSLNHIYRTVWNEALGAVVAVAETATCNRGTASCTVAGSAIVGSIPAFAPSALVLALALAWGITPQAHANPTGGVAIQGQATMATKGNVLTVTTQNGAGTSHSAINWQSFSIPAGNVTRFDQPNAASTSINRVVSNTPSVLFGTLSSNGKVVLVNQSGIAVGAGAVVDTAGFTAAAMKMSETDAMSGRLRFDGAHGLLGVQGNIISRGGDVVLIAPSIELARDAVVESQGGSVVLAAGQKVEVTGRGLEGISLQVQAPTDQALNLGTLKGDAVGIFAGTLKHSGSIQATQASMEGGKVVLKAAGDTYVEGNATINASSDKGKGGTVAVLGQRVAVTDNARIDASGASGGGTVLVGGDYQGKNQAVQNASVTYVGPDTQLKADADDKGDGGKVIVWADDTTRAYGSISTRGGANGGDGGFVEASGKHYLDYQGQVDTQAPKGEGGTLLLDPFVVSISNLTSTNMSATAPFAPTDPDSASILSTSTLEGALRSTNVRVDASASSHSQIKVESPVNWSSANSLTLKTNTSGGVYINAGITATDPGANLILDAGSEGISQTAPIQVSGLKITSTGNVNLSMVGNSVGKIAGSITGSGFQLENVSSLEVGSVDSTDGLMITGGDATLKTNGMLKISSPVTATAGNVTYVTDNIAHNAATTTSSAPDKFAYVYPSTAATTVELGLPTDGTGVLRMDTSELNNFKTPLLKIGSSASTGAITVVSPIASNATSFGSMSLITGGAISQTTGSTISIANLNADGGAGVTLTESNAVTNLAGRTQSGNFAFTNNADLNISQVDVVSGIESKGGGNITLTSTGKVTQDSNSTLKSSGALIVSAQNGISLSDSLNEAKGATNLTNSNTGNLVYTGSMNDALGVTATNVNGDVHLSSAGDLPLGAITGKIVELTSIALAITDANGTAVNVTADDLRLTANAGIGSSGDAIETQVGKLSASTIIDGDIFVANSGRVMTLGTISPAPVPPGAYRWLIYADNPASVIKGGNTSTFRKYNNETPPTTGNGFVYASAPGTVNVDTILASGSASHIFGSTPTAVFDKRLVNASSFDSEDFALISGTPTFSPVISSTTNAGAYSVLYASGLTSTAGYTFSPGIAVAYTVNRAPLTVVTAALTGATTKTYDGTTTATLVPANFQLTGFIKSDSANVTKTSGTYASRDVGSGILVSTSLTNSDFTPVGSTLLSNYSLPTSASGPIGSITPAPLTVTAKDASKTFGQTLSFTGNEFSASGLRNGETIGSVALSSTGAAASASVAGGPYPIIPSNASGGTFHPGNYSVTYVNGVLTVTPATLTAVAAALTGTTTKTYDGTTTATLTPANFLLSGFVNGDSASVTKTTGDYASQNVATNLMVSTSLASFDFAPAGATQLSNYSLPTSASGPIGSITPAALTVTAKDASKTFGQTLSFTGNEFSASGLRNGETIGSVALSSTGAVASASVAGGPYPIIPSSASGGTFSPGNYSVTYVNGVLTVTPATLTAVAAALTGTTTKTYDGTTAATLTPANFLLSGFVDGDSASVTKTTGDYESKNVGSSLMVSTSLSSSDFAPAGATQLSNYSLPTSASGPIGTITPASLAVTAKDASKTFGKTLSFAGSEFSASGLQNGETIGSVSLSSTGAVASASVAGGPYPIIPSNASGGTFDSGNYTVTYVNGVLTVTPATLTAVAAALTGTTTKTYDGTTTATLTPANFLLSGFVDGDSASVTKTTGDYASKNVGANLMVSTSLASSDFAPVGATQLSNYNLPTSASGAIGSITPASLTVTANDASKTFGQTLGFTGNEFRASGLQNGETIGSVALSSMGAVASASVAGGPYPIIPSNANGGTFSPGNYNVTYVNGVLTVSPATLTAVTAALTGTTTKTYDGTTVATLTPANFLLGGFVNGDSASVTKTTGNYTSQNVGSNLMVSTSLSSSDFAPAGATQLSNYSLPTSASGPIGTITPASLTVIANDASKTFGKTLSFTGGEFSASGLQNGETIGSVTLSSTGTAANAGVAGGPYPIIPSSASGGTFDPGNYNVTYVNGVFTVTPATLTAVAAALTGSTTKTYDGTTTAALTPANFLLSGFVNGDSASVTKTTGNYESKNVGSNLMVSTSLARSDFAPAGATQISNYSLPASASGPIGTITPAPLAVTAKDASKTFGQTLSFAGSEFNASGLQNGETIGNVVLNSAGAVASASVAGSPYPIIPSNANGGTFSLSNYNVTYLNGALVVNSTQTGTPGEPPPLVVFNEPSSLEAGMARAPTNLVAAFVEKMKAAAIETETKAEDKKKPKTDMVLEGEICRP